MKDKYLHDSRVENAADDPVALLHLCQQLQSEKDGRERVATGKYSRDEDEFADRVRVACGHATMLHQLLLMTRDMSAIVAEPERRGDIRVPVGDDDAEKALSWLMEQYSKDDAS